MVGRMCGLYTERTPADLLRRRYAAAGELPGWVPPERIARTDPAPVVRLIDGARRLDILRFGLVPGWAADVRVGAKLVNARAETVAEKPSFRAAFRQRRCLVPAESWYEWLDTARGKQIHRIARADGISLTFAGLWERWQAPRSGAAPVDSFAIVTTEATPELAEMNDRMPVILEDDAADAWLHAEPMAALRTLQPYGGALDLAPVLNERPRPANRQLSLF